MAAGEFGLGFRVDLEGARELAGFQRLVRMGGNGLRLAVSHSINRTLKSMASLASAEIRDVYYVKKGVLDKGIHISMAKAGKLEGDLAFKGYESPPLGKFDPKQGKTYVSVKVLKANRARHIQPGGKHKIIVTSKGRAAVWIARGQVMARSEESEKPIMLYGPSFMAFFRRPNVSKALSIEAEELYRKNLERQIKFYWRKAMLG